LFQQDSVIAMSQSEMEFHRETAKKCFNEAWDYLDKKNRDANDEQQMLHLAHAARYHRSFVGTAKNFAVGDWQISRVYAALNQSELALHFAKSALEIMQGNNLSEMLCTGYEGMARAHAVAKDYPSAKDYVKKAREQLKKTTGLDDEDRKIYSDQIRETEELIGR
jgi:tetratricopeptide (TPR) repeat protein